MKNKISKLVLKYGYEHKKGAQLFIRKFKV